jgi:hypothetical protein
LLARTNLNVLVGLMIVMPAIGLMKTYSLDLYPQQGLQLLHATHCSGDLETTTHAKDLKHSAVTYSQIAERQRKKQIDINRIESTISSNPTYQILSMVLCGHDTVYDPFHIYTSTDNKTTSGSSTRNTALQLHDSVNVKQLRSKIARHLKLRTSEVWHVVVDGNTTNSGRSRWFSNNTSFSSVTVSLRSVHVSHSMFSISLTITLLIVVVVWSSAFVYDYQDLITKPLHHIIHLLRRLASNPRLAVDFGVQQRQAFKQGSTLGDAAGNVAANTSLFGSRGSGNGSPTSSSSNHDTNSSSGNNPHYTSEIQIIEASIAKFGRLLHVGFGEAGVTIIARNLLRGKFDPVSVMVLTDVLFF